MADLNDAPRSEISLDDTGVDPFLDYTETAGDQNALLEELPFWGDSPISWQTVKLAEFVLPGIAAVSGKIAMRKDRKKVAGKNGARYTHIGYEPAEVNITLRLWTPRHWTIMKSLALLIRPRANQGPPKAFDIAHPALALYGIASVEILEAGYPKMAETDIYEVEIKAMEFIPPAANAAKVSTPKAATAGSGAEVLFSGGPIPATFGPPPGPADQKGPNAPFQPNFTPGQ